MKWKLVPVAADMTDDIAEAIALEAKCCGGIAHTIYVKALAAAPNALDDAELVGRVAAVLDYPSVYMGGPSEGNMRRARAVIAAMGGK